MSDRSKDRVFGVVLFSLFVGVMCWIFYASLNADNFPAWTGFGMRNAADDIYPARMLWDWLSLLLVPVVLAFGGLIFTWFENRQSRELEDNRAQDAIVKDYFDQMTELLLTRGLRTSLVGDEVRSVARARTLTALRGVDAVRKVTILQFLYEAQLIGYLNGKEVVAAVVHLREANLSGVDLSGTNLSGVNLSWANLNRSSLAMARLKGARLKGAKLEGTKLFGADLTEAIFLRADLTEANLQWSVLKGAKLFGVDLTGANLKKANLTEADLTEAILLRANLKKANLVKAQLTRTNVERFMLTETNPAWNTLFRVILFGAKLTEAKYTLNQLLEAKSLHGAILPDHINPADLGDKWSPPETEDTPEPTP